MFVMMEYFAYLRRAPDESGYQFWLNKLNQFGGNFEQAEMVKAFIVRVNTATAFRDSNLECADLSALWSVATCRDLGSIESR
jgi:hypothetical protein